jgi:hypothetical protein
VRDERLALLFVRRPLLVRIHGEALLAGVAPEDAALVPARAPEAPRNAARAARPDLEYAITGEVGPADEGDEGDEAPLPRPPPSLSALASVHEPRTAPEVEG